MTNNITGPEEGTALHWHGILQKGHPWQDGVPAVTQCPVAPGKSFTYSFTADLCKWPVVAVFNFESSHQHTDGSSWYHSHYSAQYAGGLFGPMVIHGPSKQKYDIDVGPISTYHLPESIFCFVRTMLIVCPIVLSDWYHKEYFDLVEETMDPAAAGPVFSDNNLINGKNNYDCSQLPSDDKTPCNSNAGISKFKFKKNKVHRLRLINPGAEALQRFSIDGHKMTVIANDFVPVEPYETDVVTIGIGQRTDVLVKADQTPGAYYMRSNISTICSLGRNPNAVAAIYYDGTDETKTPDSKAWDRPDPGTCANDDLTKTKPTFKLKPPTPDTVYDIEVSLGRNATGHLLWSMDDVSFRGNFNSPTFLLAKLGNLTFDPIWNVKNTKKAKSVRVHVINNTPVAHPMHLHGFNMYILNEGTGTWDGTTVNPSNPQRRDVQQLRGGGYMVMQFDAADNPGKSPLSTFSSNSFRTLF